jgi:hypothetical protein
MKNFNKAFTTVKQTAIKSMKFQKLKRGGSRIT